MMKLNKLMSATVATGLLAVSASSSAALTYSQDFEGLDPNNAGALSGDGWLIGNCIVSGGSGCWFGPGNGAPNNTADGNNGYSSVVTGEGDVPQGNNQLSTYSDYNPWGPLNLAGDQTVDTFVYRDIGLISAADFGTTFTFDFDLKAGNIDTAAFGSQAFVYINVLDASGGTYATLGNAEVEVTNIGTSWSGDSLSLLIDSAWDGDLVQIGFRTTTVESGGVWDSSGMVYDNINASNVAAAVPVPAAAWLFGSALAGLAVSRKKK